VYSYLNIIISIFVRINFFAYLFRKIYLNFLGKTVGKTESKGEKINDK